MQQRRDSEIEQRVLHELRVQPEIRSKELCVFCADGVATLSGTVNKHHDKRFAEVAAERARGVVTVINNINVKEISEQPVKRPSLTANVAMPSAHAG